MGCLCESGSFSHYSGPGWNSNLLCLCHARTWGPGSAPLAGIGLTGNHAQLSTYCGTFPFWSAVFRLAGINVSSFRFNDWSHYALAAAIVDLPGSDPCYAGPCFRFYVASICLLIKKPDMGKPLSYWLMQVLCPLGFRDNRINNRVCYWCGCFWNDHAWRVSCHPPQASYLVLNQRVLNQPLTKKRGIIGYNYCKYFTGA